MDSTKERIPTLTLLGKRYPTDEKNRAYNMMYGVVLATYLCVFPDGLSSTFRWRGFTCSYNRHTFFLDEKLVYFFTTTVHNNNFVACPALIQTDARSVITIMHDLDHAL